jgi:hypothetical protein
MRGKCQVRRALSQEKLMPVYFLNIRDQNDDLIPDPEAQDCVDADAARMEALQAAREMVADRVLAGKPVNDTSVEIMNSAGDMIDSVSFASVLVI